MPEYACPWPSDAAREREHIRAIRACIREYRDLPGPALLRELASIHLEFARPDMAAEREAEAKGGAG